ncbi:MAG: hypothetical protein A2W93_01100 [Bacteroidetes bacterium GWF2_43_63]|nr:MAG: hypothetical protein A2W94_11500 [Bacteroidetes bacterium GWE2_42_42]OFY54712.1 MAG: hypothetical protein A2W93_01100 [Bacteroidetes bacterium GWF2_43_63]HBG69709.1 hypothetical protein [Bacteroidales bacterium]HCB63132.1 hypothetical protein [Bacteroidales bacterium]HCY22155.1 hypothetical protein [Bacteroidales bacterium]
MKPATIREIISKIGSALGDLYSDPSEGKSVAELLLSDLLHTTRAGLYGIGGKIDDPQMLGQIQQCFDRLLNNEPVQYVLGKTWFCGLELMVAPGVLIPRPETEELAEWLIENHEAEQYQLEIIDIGSGSGCLALALKSRMPGATVTGIDISESALALSSKNAVSCGLDVKWLKLDILTEKCPVNPLKKLIVVSNPPYVLESEKTSMDERVKKYEPGSALFVPDEDPLLFYRRIVDVFKTDSSAIYFEINPLTRYLFQDLAKINGLNIKERTDFCGKSRMICLAGLSGI